ncbi:hypothetical protein [Clostridium sp.]|uniref:hypothetical protein n=1 Tax=Clostridium sp. TaxID=1506 RepID=UPI003D6CC6AA
MSIKKKNIIIALALIAIIAIGSIFYFKSTEIKSVDGYLTDNYETENFTEDGMSSAFKLIDDSEGYNIFFTGEGHGNLGNEKINFQMLKFLYKEAGVKYLICEMQYSIVSKLNKYIQGGDEALLKDAVDVVKKRNPKYGGEDYYKFWQELYDYNKGLPNDKKIQAFGIDVDFMGDYTLKEMKSLIPNTKPPIEIENKVNDFIRISSGKVSEEEAITVFTNLNEDFSSNTQVYKTFLGDNFNDFKNNLNSMMNTIRYVKIQDPKDPYPDPARDDFIYDNFMRIYEGNPRGKYYGQFGEGHIYRENILYDGKDYFTLAKMMEKQGKFKVLSIPIINNNQGILINEAEKLAKYKFTIFKLNGKKSPYGKKIENLYTSYQNVLTNGTTVDNYQYLIYLSY